MMALGSRASELLVVDDSPYVREVLAEILTRGGAKVTAVGSAEEALATLQWDVRCVLSDLAMPGKGGYWLIGQVRALPPERAWPLKQRRAAASYAKAVFALAENGTPRRRVF